MCSLNYCVACWSTAAVARSVNKAPSNSDGIFGEGDEVGGRLSFDDDAALDVRAAFDPLVGGLTG